MELSDLKVMNKTELQRVLAETREKLRQSRFRVHEGAEKKIRTLRELKRTIARVLTLLKQI